MKRILTLAFATALAAHTGAEVLTRADSGLKAADGDFYVMSEVDAKLRRERRIVLDHAKD